MKNKKLLIGIGVLVVIATAIVLAIVFLGNSEVKQTAKDIAPYLPDYSTKQIEDILNEEVEGITKEDLEEMESMHNFSEAANILEDNDEYITYENTDGSIVSIDKQDYGFNLSDEEADKLLEEQMSKYEAWLKDTTGTVEDPFITEEIQQPEEEEEEEFDPTKDYGPMPIIPGAEIIDNTNTSGMTEEEALESIRNGSTDGFGGTVIGG